MYMHYLSKRRPYSSPHFFHEVLEPASKYSDLLMNLVGIFIFPHNNSFMFSRSHSVYRTEYCWSRHGLMQSVRYIPNVFLKTFGKKILSLLPQLTKLIFSLVQRSTHRTPGAKLGLFAIWVYLQYGSINI